MNRMIVSCALAACFPLATFAAGQGEERGLTGNDAETQTGYWLRVQREGQLASSHPQTSTPTERELALKRWLESHNHPIPEYFDQDVGGELGE